MRPTRERLSGLYQIIISEKNNFMEVHAHSHTERKKWTHYFWEFLMLFLAVFCGFLAEYQLEHKIEKDRAKELARSLYEELQQDSVNMSVRLKNRVRQEASLKWLMKYFKDSSLTNVSNALIAYDVWVRNRKEYEPLQAELANGMNQYLEKLLDPGIIDDATRAYTYKQLEADTSIARSDRMDLPVIITISKLAATDKKAILKYINQVKTIYLETMRDNMSEKKQAVKTLALITLEYHIN